MKKLVAVFGLFVIGVSVAFADINVSGLAGAESTLLKGNSDNGKDLKASGLLFARLQAVAQNDDGSFGALVRMKIGYNENEPGNTYAWAWWKPVDQVRLQIGFLDALAVSDLVNWSYNENDAEDYIAAAGYEYSGGIFDRSTGFYNGTWWTGALVSVYPIHGLTINLAVPFGPGNFFGPGYVSPNRNTTGDYNAADVYQHLNAQVLYTFDGIGRAALSFKGGGDGTLDYTGDYPSDPAASVSNTDIEANASTLYASFYLFMFRDTAFNFGLAYTTPAKSADLNTTYYSPLAAGIGFSYKPGGKFTLKSRLAFTFAGNAATSRGTLHDPVKLGFGVLPSYDFNILKLYFNAGISYKAEDESADSGGNVGKVRDSSAFGWHINPYITRRIGAGIFFGGIRFESDGVKRNGGKPVIEWSVPIAIQFEL